MQFLTRTRYLDITVFFLILIPFDTLVVAQYQVELAADGRARLPVVVSEDASARVQSAAADLSSYLGRMSDSDFVIQSSDGRKGIAVGTAALILVLSVFNGFEDLISLMYSRFNPDVKITAAKGKTFEIDSTVFRQLSGIEGVGAISQTLEEEIHQFFQNPLL